MFDISLIIYHFILPMLEFFKHSLGNYGWAIIVVTLIVKIFLLPFSIKQASSMKKNQKKMALIQPEIQKIKDKFELRKKKYENEPEKLNEIQKEFQQQIMEVYQKNGGINPLSGCLPQLAQFPIIMALYWTFYAPPFQAGVMTLPISVTDKLSTSQQAQIVSKEVNFVDHIGRIGRYRINAPITGGQAVINEAYELKIERTQGNSELQNRDIYWKLLGSDEKNKNNNKNIFTKSELENTELPPWAKNNLEFAPSKPEDLSKATLKINKKLQNFSVEAVLLNPRGQESFLFISDLGKMGIWDHKKKEFHFDVAILLALFILTMFLSMKTMGNTQQMPSLDENQEKMQKQMQVMMPMIILVLFIVFPTPAAVFLYFVATNVFQLIQSKLLEFLPSKDNENEIASQSK